MEKIEKIIKGEVLKPTEVLSMSVETGSEAVLFKEYFASIGYTEHPPLQLTPPETDQTVPYVGSSVNAFKIYLENRTNIESPAFILQPCIRTHDIINAYDISNIPFGMPYFHIYGTFSPGGTYEKTAVDVMGYLRETHKISNDDILIKPTVPSLSESLLDPFVAIGANVEIDNSRFYQWKYGVEGVSGRGVTLFVRHADGEWWDVGNLVSIRDESDKEIAVEFGVGVEFFETAIHGYTDPFEASIMAKVVKPRDSLHKKVLTYLEVALTTSGTFADGRDRTTRMSNRYINAVYYLCEVQGYHRDEVESIARQYKNVATTTVDVDLFMEKYDLRTKIVQGIESIFINFIQNPANADEEYTRNQLTQYMKRNGIRNEELILRVEKKYKENSAIQSLCRNF